MSYPCFVAEVSSNHQRDLARCLHFVEVAAEIGCAAVKFQQFRVRRLFAPEALRHAPGLLERESWELPESFVPEIARHARAHGVTFASTPFYLEAVEVLAPWVDFFKVSSYQILWTDLLREVARTGKPVVLATGMATLEEVHEAVRFLRAEEAGPLVVLHCVSAYPTPPEEANLAAIETLRAELGTEVGWSDHTTSKEVVVRAVQRFGASMVEAHVDIDGHGAEHKSGHCWLPGPLRRAISAARSPRDVPAWSPFDGDGRKLPRPPERVEREWRSDPSDGLRPLLATRGGLERVA